MRVGSLFQMAVSAFLAHRDIYPDVQVEERGAVRCFVRSGTPILIEQGQRTFVIVPSSSPMLRSERKNTTFIRNHGEETIFWLEVMPNEQAKLLFLALKAYRGLDACPKTIPRAKALPSDLPKQKRSNLYSKNRADIYSDKLQSAPQF